MKTLPNTPTNQKTPETKSTWLSSMKLEANTKVSKAEACETAKEDFTTKTEATMKATGRTTKWTVSANYTMKAVKWLTKGCGLRTNSTVSAKSTTIIL